MKRPPASAIEPHERPIVGASFALFFFVLASWYVLRPLRDAMGVLGSTRDLPRLFLFTLGVTLAGTPALSALVSRVPRRRSLVHVYRFFLVTLVAFYVVLRGDAPSPGAARAFFVWASVVNLFALSLAWGFMSDIFTREEGIRVFAVVGAGGTVGAIVGSIAAVALVEHVGTAAGLLVAAALLECAARCVGRVAALAQRHRAHHGPGVGAGDANAPGGGALGWIRTALTSRYFLGICAYLALFTFTSTALYFEQARIVKSSFADTAARAALFARMDLAVNVLTLILQLFVVGRTLPFIGVGAALAALPALTLVCFVSLRVAPALAVLVVCQVTRRALDFALTKPAREVLFTVVQPEDKYKAKTFIDTFVYRGGDALAAASFEGIPVPALTIGMAVVCAAWAAIGLALGARRT